MTKTGTTKANFTPFREKVDTPWGKFDGSWAGRLDAVLGDASGGEVRMRVTVPRSELARRFILLTRMTIWCTGAVNNGPVTIVLQDLVGWGARGESGFPYHYRSVALTAMPVSASVWGMPNEGGFDMPQILSLGMPFKQSDYAEPYPLVQGTFAVNTLNDIYYVVADGLWSWASGGRSE